MANGLLYLAFSRYLKFENRAIFMKSIITIQRDSFKKLEIWTVGIMVLLKQSQNQPFFFFFKI